MNCTQCGKFIADTSGIGYINRIGLVFCKKCADIGVEITSASSDTLEYFADGVLTDRTCLLCNGKLNYCEKHDAFYCKACDIWASNCCGDSDCSYCNTRPARPSEVEEIKK